MTESTLATAAFGFALLLSLGTLVLYLSGAIWVRLTSPADTSRLFAFNLDSTSFGDKDELFAVALVAAGTSLSTVFLFFLTAGTRYGWWIVVCPLLFALGNFLMFGVYRRARRNGYFVEGQYTVAGASGLLPYLGKRLTGSNTVSFLLMVISMINLLAVLVLEMTVGVDVFIYLTTNAFGPYSSPGWEFVIFAVSLGLLLGYVFVGGFAAVLASDLWQLKIISWAIVLSLASFVVYGVSTSKPIDSIALSVSQADYLTLITFIVGVTLGNLLIPLSQESSWQRFRAFGDDSNFNVRRALNKSIVKSICLWLGLILLAIGLQMMMPGRVVTLVSMPEVLDAFRTINDWWFPLCIFPVMTVAALSAMYSTADTCVSAILYLVDYAWASLPSQKAIPERADDRFPSTHYWAMGILFGLCLGIYALVKFWFHPTILQLVFSVLSNLIVVAPTVLMAAYCPPVAAGTWNSSRTTTVVCSLVLGTVCFWATAGTAIAMGGDLEWLSQLAVLPGLLGALAPILVYALGNAKPSREAVPAK